MSRSLMHGSLRSTLALILCVSVSACSTTTHVTLPSPELSAMNVRTHDARSTLTLVNGRQLEVERLHVGAEQTRVRVSRERTVDQEGRAQSAWLRVDDGPREVTLPSAEVSRVELRTDKVKGGFLGALGGGLLGTGIGAGIGVGVGKAMQNDCFSPPRPGYPSYESCRDDNRYKTLVGLVSGMIAGAILFTVVGAAVGSRGKERVYVFDSPEAQVETPVQTAVEPVR